MQEPTEDLPRDPFEEAALERLREQFKAEKQAAIEAREALMRQMEELEKQAQERLARLEAQANEIKTRQQRRAEARRIEAEKNKAITIHVLGLIDNKKLYFHTNEQMREDILQLLRTIPDRRYEYGKNYLPLTEWTGFLEKVLILPNVEVTYASDQLANRVHELANMPPWEVRLSHDNKLIAKPRPDQNRFVFGEVVLGSEWDWDLHSWVAPASEAWRIGELLSDTRFEGAVFSPEVQVLIVEQMAKRTRLDEVALKLTNGAGPSPEYDIDLNGNRLKPFQALSNEFIDVAGGRVLLAHEMGLGKTWIAIAYAMFKQMKQVVIICSASLKPNWEKEILKLTGEEACILNGRYPSTWDIEYLLKHKPRFIIINYSIIGARLEVPNKDNPEEKRNAFLWAETLNMLQPDMYVLDEVHHIRNSTSLRSQACRKLQAPHILGLTGTPVVNRPGEYWPILYMIDPVLFPYNERFKSDYTYNGKEVKNVKQLRELLRPIMLRYTHSDVQKDLPPVNRMQRYHTLSDEALERYIDVLKGVYRMLEIFDPHGKGGKESNVMNILAEITRLKQISAADKVETTAELAREIYDSQEDTGKKIIIFSKFKATAYRISQLLGSEAVCTVDKTATDFVTVDKNERFRRVEEVFQKDPDIHYICTTYAASGEGLNMTAAWTVIFNDLPYTPKDCDQGIGRARGRLNDSHNVDNYTIISEKPESYKGPKETVDQWLLDLLGFKEDIIEQTVDGVESSRDRDGSVAMALIKKMKEAMHFERNK